MCLDNCLVAQHNADRAPLLLIKHQWNKRLWLKTSAFFLRGSKIILKATDTQCWYVPSTNILPGSWFDAQRSSDSFAPPSLELISICLPLTNLPSCLTLHYSPPPPWPEAINAVCNHPVCPSDHHRPVGDLPPPPSSHRAVPVLANRGGDKAACM